MAEHYTLLAASVHLPKYTSEVSHFRSDISIRNPSKYIPSM